MTDRDTWETSGLYRRLAPCNPLYGNPLKSRDDLARAVQDLWRPLSPFLSPGGAKMRLGAEAAQATISSGELEAMARPLWGIAPLVAGGGDFAELPRFLDGFRNGPNPARDEYWGDVGDRSQKMVEMACLAFTLLIAPDAFWTPLDEAERQRLSAWLRSINDHETADNNWLFFGVLTNLALRKLGQEWSEEKARWALNRIDDLGIGDGFFRDGPGNRVDYYGPMALHFYGLVIAQVAGDAFPEHAKRARERARAFGPGFRHWFAGNGAAIPYGRSLTYRFAQAAFWSASAFADEEVLPWGRMKGLLLRHLRWWADRPIAGRDGVLANGYGYPNLLTSENYNSAGSPYWAMKAFLVLALPVSHPFWQAEELEEPEPEPRVLQPAGGFLLRGGRQDAVMLTGGQNCAEHRGGSAKYGRFAYSSAFAFSVPSEISVPDRPERSAVDSGLMISADGRMWQARGDIPKSGVDGEMVWGRWQAAPRIAIDSWLDFGPPGWHFRLHRIDTVQPLSIAESGFSLDRTGDDRTIPEAWRKIETGRGFLHTPSAISGILDMAGQREAQVITAWPNTNLIYPRTAFPRLTGKVSAGVTWLLTGVFAVPDPQAEIPEPVLPETMRRLIASERAIIAQRPGAFSRLRGRVLRIASVAKNG